IAGDMEVAKAFVRLPFDHLFFTGSTAVGREVAAAAARNLTPLTLELGGKSPAIVDADARLEVAARGLVTGKWLNAGQTCIAPDYALVRRDRVDAFCEKIRDAVQTSYPAIAANPDYTSIIDARHYQRLVALIEDARAKGARVIEI